MKTIQTKPDCTLGFVKESIVLEGLIEKKGNVYTWKANGFWHGYEAIGKLSEITEEQAKELVDYDEDVDGRKYYLDYRKVGGRENGRGWIFTEDPISSLRSAALSVGIEEKDFDKILVIKL